jgi:hypothetical protein
MSERVDVVDDVEPAVEEGPAGRVEHQEIAVEQIDAHAEDGGARQLCRDVGNVVQTDDAANERRQPEVGARRRGHSLNQVVKSCSGARSVIKLFGTAPGSA